MTGSPLLFLPLHFRNDIAFEMEGDKRNILYGQFRLAVSNESRQRLMVQHPYICIFGHLFHKPTWENHDGEMRHSWK